MTPEDAVAGIAATVTGQGLKCTAVLDDAALPRGGQGPRRPDAAPGGPRPGPRPLPRRVELHRPARPGRTAAAGPASPQRRRPPTWSALAAEAGIGDLGALLDAVTLPWQAAREQRLHLARGHARRKDSGCAPLLPLAAVITAAARHHRLAATYRQLGDLLGAHPSTVSLAVRRITPILEQQGIAPRRPAKDNSHRDTPETANLKTDAAISA